MPGRGKAPVAVAAIAVAVAALGGCAQRGSWLSNGPVPAVPTDAIGITLTAAPVPQAPVTPSVPRTAVGDYPCPPAADVENLAGQAPLSFSVAANTCVYMTGSLLHGPGHLYGISLDRPGDKTWMPLKKQRFVWEGLAGETQDAPELGERAFSFSFPAGRTYYCGLAFPYGDGYFRVQYTNMTGNNDPAQCAKLPAIARLVKNH